MKQINSREIQKLARSFEPKPAHMNVSLSKMLYYRVCEAADLQGISRSEFVRRALIKELGS